MPCENIENHENLRIPYENHGTNENHRIQRKIYKNHENTRMPCDNH